MLNGENVAYEDNGTDKNYYTYDSDGSLVSMNLNGVEYYYIRNLQGDIIVLFDKNGTLASTVGMKNPYRYRGYRYDTETGLYYLQSRYYNSEWSRFINADGYLGTPGELLSHNLFEYSANNPINRNDPNGESWGALVAGATAVFAIPVEVTAVLTVAAIAVVAAGIYALADIAVQEYRNNHVSYVDSSTPSDNTSGTSSNGGGGGGGSSSPKPPKKPRKSTHGHHAYPKALGGAATQELIEIAPDLHRRLHSALYKFEDGWLAPKRGYTGNLIQRLYGAKKIQAGLTRFYNSDEEFKIIIDTFNEAIKFTEKYIGR